MSSMSSATRPAGWGSIRARPAISTSSAPWHAKGAWEMSEIGTTTFRPPYTPVSFGAIGGIREESVVLPYRHTPITAWNHAEGAFMYEAGARWRRPGYFPREGESFQETVNREARAVREGVGIYDGSPLGKFELKGSRRRAVPRLHLHQRHVEPEAGQLPLRADAQRCGPDSSMTAWAMRLGGAPLDRLNLHRPRGCHQHAYGGVAPDRVPRLGSHDDNRHQPVEQRYDLRDRERARFWRRSAPISIYRPMPSPSCPSGTVLSRGCPRGSSGSASPASCPSRSTWRPAMCATSGTAP